MIVIDGTMKQKEQQRPRQESGRGNGNMISFFVRLICVVALISVGWSANGVYLDYYATSTSVVAREESSHEQSNLFPYNRSFPSLPLKSNETYLVLHFGPGKMATTYLQEVARRLDDEVLPLDNFIYDGHIMKHFRLAHGTPLTDALRDKDCHKQVHIASIDGDSLPSCWENLEMALEGYQGKNVLMSDEMIDVLAFTEPWWDHFKGLTSRLGYRIVVVLAYRRLYEWLPSLHAQANRLTKREKFGKWPHQNRDKYVAVGSISEYLAGNPYINTKPPQVVSGKWPGIWTTSYISTIPDDLEIRLFNMHAKTNHSTATTFFCNMIPGAERTCEECFRMEQSQSDVEESSNAAIDTSFDVVSVAAANAGLINTTKYSRKQIRMTAEAFSRDLLHQSAADLPRLCLSKDELERILNVSLQWEALIWPNDEQDEEGLRAGFESAVAKKKFCDVDAARVLAMPEWKRFFEQFAD